MQSKTYIIISVDTEADIINGRVIPVSKMIYGEVDGGYYGIGKIMDLCDKYNCKATFFLSTFESDALGGDQIKQVCLDIYSRGHDVQLHTHPKWITSRRFMADHSLREQREMLLSGKQKIHTWTGESPVAHRAGGFGVNPITLTALKEVGIPIDSSFISDPNCKLQKQVYEHNTVQVSPEGIIQLPVFEFAQFKIGNFKPIKPVDINANTFSELKFVSKTAKENNTKVVTLLMHSFSFLERNKKRTEFKLNKSVVKKFENFLKLVTSDDAFQIITVKDFYEMYSHNPDAFIGEEYLPISGFSRSTIRAFRYIKAGKGNKLIAFAVSMLTLLCAGLLFSFF